MSETRETVLVAPASEMDKYAFTQHMTRRHHDSLAGLPELPGNITDAVEEAYRAFHRQLHRTRTDLQHSHREE